MSVQCYPCSTPALCDNDPKPQALPFFLVDDRTTCVAVHNAKWAGAASVHPCMSCTPAVWCTICVSMCSCYHGNVCTSCLVYTAVYDCACYHGYRIISLVARGNTYASCLLYTVYITVLVTTVTGSAPWMPPATRTPAAWCTLWCCGSPWCSSSSTPSRHYSPTPRGCTNRAARCLSGPNYGWWAPPDMDFLAEPTKHVDRKSIFVCT